MGELDAGAIGKPGAKAGNGNGSERPISQGGLSAPASDARLEGLRLSVLDNLRRQAVEGQKHTALLTPPSPLAASRPRPDPRRGGRPVAHGCPADIRG